MKKNIILVRENNIRMGIPFGTDFLYRKCVISKSNKESLIMANKTNTPSDVDRQDLSQHKDLITYKQLQYNKLTGAVYLETFYCILGEPVAYKNTKLVPCVHLTKPDVNGAQFATTDALGKVRVTARDEAWLERTTESQVELDSILDGFATQFATANAK